MTEMTTRHADDYSDYTEPVGDTYNPSQGEKDAVKLVNKLFTKAKKHKKDLAEKWLDYHKMFRGHQWLTPRPTYRHSEVINLIWQAIQSEIPQMTDSRPTINFLPVEPTDGPFADLIDKLWGYDWDRYNWNETLLECLYDSHVVGTGIGSLWFDPLCNYGLGSMKFESKDPWYIYPDPNARDINKRCEFFIDAEPMDTEIIKKLYPEKAKYIKPDVSGLADLDKEDLAIVRYRSPIDNNVLLEGQTVNPDWQKTQTLLITALIKDQYDVEEVKKQVSPDQTVEQTTEQYYYEQRMKYPNGRKIVIAGDVLLEDDAVKELDDNFPYARLVNYCNPRNFWGISDVEQEEGPQKLFNKVISFTMDVMTLMGNPIWIIDTNSGIDTNAVPNQPGAILEPEPNTRVQRVDGAQLQPYVINVIDHLQTWFNDIAGSSDVSRGVKPPQVTAARAIESLQEAGGTRTRLKMRNMDNFLRDIGRIYVSRVLQYYTIPRIIRITNNQNVKEFYSMSIEHAGKGQGHVARVRQVSQNGQTLGEEIQMQIKGELDVTCSSASGLPFVKAEREIRHLQLFDRGIIDAEEVLRGIEFPNAEAVLARIAQKQVTMAQTTTTPPGQPQSTQGQI